MNDTLSRDIFIQLCPSLVYLKTSGVCDSKGAKSTEATTVTVAQSIAIYEY